MLINKKKGSISRITNKNKTFQLGSGDVQEEINTEYYV